MNPLKVYGGMMAIGIALIVTGFLGLTVASATTSTHPILRWTTTGAELVIPTPSCPASEDGCRWQLFVNEPNAGGGPQPVVGSAIGTSGTLFVAFPQDCGIVVQADALLQLPGGPWIEQRGIRTTVPTSVCSGTTTTSVPGTTTSSSTTSTTVAPTTTTLPPSTTTSSPTTSTTAPPPPTTTSSPSTSTTQPVIATGGRPPGRGWITVALDGALTWFGAAIAVAASWSLLRWRTRRRAVR